LRLAGAAIEAADVAEVGTGINDVGIARIDGDVAALAATDIVPIPPIDEAAIATGTDTDGGIVLLRAVDAIREIVVGDDVVELRGGLIVLRRPILACVDGNRGATVVGIDHASGIVGIDPQPVMIAVWGRNAVEGFAAIDGAEKPGVGDVNGVRIFRVGPDVGEIPGALTEAAVFIDERPVIAAVGAAVEAALVGFDKCVDGVGIAARDADGDAAEGTGGKAIAGEPLPGGTVVTRSIQGALVSTAVEGPRRAIALPHGGEQHMRVVGIEDDVDAAGAVVDIENFFPGLAAIPGTEDAAFGVGAVRVA